VSNPAIFDTYTRAPIAFVRGEGVWLETDDGRRVLDFSSGIAVNALGHAHPALVAALTGQAERLWHVSNLYRIPEQEALAEALCANSFADRVFFGNSGAEAIECAIKTARRYHFASGDTGRTRIITFQGAFHGRTLAALAATGNDKYLEGFGEPPPGFDQVAPGDPDAVEAAVTAETAAILIEPVQGEGGLREMAPSFLKALRDICDRHGLLLIFDEVQTGMGRTGTLFAHEPSGITPDIMALAKGLGGGFPLGACLATEAAAKAMTPGTHGTTFGGNQLAMAVGKAVIDIVAEPAFLEHVRRVGLYAKQRLAAVVDAYPDLLGEVRGEGLLAGVRCIVPVADVASALRTEDLLVVPAGENVLRLLPPLIVTEAEIDEAIARMERALHTLQAGIGSS